MKRLTYEQAARKSVYCVQGVHVTITDPQHSYSGDPHGIELTECDCVSEPSTPTGERSDGRELTADAAGA